MESFILEDIESLLKLKKGDSTRLNRIKELCENKKVVSISDRKYVERLVSQYLHGYQGHQMETKNSQPTPDAQKIEKIPSKPEPQQEKPPAQLEITTKREEQTEPEKPSAIKKQSLELSSGKKMGIGISAIGIAIVLIIVVAVGNLDSDVDQFIEAGKIKNLSPPYVFVTTDESSYKKADIISISGESNPIIDGNIRVSIQNSLGKEIWVENVQVKEKGEFTTLIIAAGPGWEKSGKYTLIAEHDSLDNQVSFDFTA